jgi:hypothetical protein
MNPGPAVADVHVIRRGKGAAQVRVALRNTAPDAGSGPSPDRPPLPDGAAGTPPGGLVLIATFVRDRHGPDVRAAAPPRVRALADSPDALDGAPRNPHSRFRFYAQLECRIADGPRFWSDPDGPAVDGDPFVAGPARYARWFRYRAPQRDAAGRLDRLALPPLVDTMPTALHRAIGPGSYRFYAPSLDLTLYCVDDTQREWLLVAVALKRARAGWAIADAEVWDDEGRFLAHGSQAMYLHTLAGEPPVIDATGR